MKLPPLDIELCDEVHVGLLNMKKKIQRAFKISSSPPFVGTMNSCCPSCTLLNRNRQQLMCKHVHTHKHIP